LYKAVPILATILILAVPVAAWWLVQLPLPPLDALVYAPELADAAVVRFDGRAVPYIEANSDRDLYLVQGYVTARDRMVQMDLMRRAALGRLSEVFGPSALAADKLMLTIGCGRLAEAEATTLSPEAREMLESYCRGVNLYLDTVAEKLPLEFRLLGYTPTRWQVRDSLAIMKYLAYEQDESWKLDELRQRIFDKVGPQLFARLFFEDWSLTPAVAGRAMPPALATALKRFARTAGSSGRLYGRTGSLGSNAWAIDAQHSASGGSLLACDKHDTFTSPDLWYCVSLKSPSQHVAGATIAGVPGVIVGRNENMAWGSAALRADVQDLFIEEFSSRFPGRYRTTSGWQEARELTEIIPVRFAKDLLYKTYTTQHGPVLLRNNYTGVALAWTGSRPGKSALEAYYKLNRAAGWLDFVNALAEYPGPPQSFVYSGRDGSVGFHAAGAIPIRSGKGQGTLLVRGWDSSGQWTGEIPFSELPAAYAPARGFLVAANQKVAGAGYRYLIGHQWGSPYRAFRATEGIQGLITSGRRPGLPDMNDLQADQKAYLSELVKQEIRQSIVRTEVIDRIQLTAMDLMDHWDGNLKPESAAAAIYESFLRQLARRLLDNKLGPELAIEYMNHWPCWVLTVQNYLREKPADWLPPEERTHPTFMLTTFSGALKQLRLAVRRDDPAGWSWAAVHQAVFRHLISRQLSWLAPLLDTGPVAIGGDQDTLDACDAGFAGEPGGFPSSLGPVMRMLVDLADNDKFYQSTCLGQSGHLFSPYRTDQLKTWRRVDPLPIAWSLAQLDRQAQHKLVLTNHK
jgi:penicillin amidase